MLYSFVCVDKAGALQTRLDNRPDHLEYLKTFGDRLVIGGPMLDNAEDKPVGSLIVAKFDSKEEAERFAADDPYAKAGLFESVTIRPYKAPFFNPEAVE